MAAMTNRDLLRLHITAVWGISVPPLEGALVELAETTTLPPWALYQARLADGQVTIWRPNVMPNEQADLLERARAADVIFDAALGMRREVVLRAPDTTSTSPAQAQHSARLLTTDDAALLEAFEVDSADYFLDPQHAPCFGVIAAGRVVSVAHSSRRTEDACELGINTLPGARRQGYAKSATQAWTAAIQREGLIPIYSAFAFNTVSLQLAAASGYKQVSASVYGPVYEARE